MTATAVSAVMSPCCDHRSSDWLELLLYTYLPVGSIVGVWMWLWNLNNPLKANDCNQAPPPPAGLAGQALARISKWPESRVCRRCEDCVGAATGPWDSVCQWPLGPKTGPESMILTCSCAPRLTGRQITTHHCCCPPSIAAPARPNKYSVGILNAIFGIYLRISIF